MRKDHRVRELAVKDTEGNYSRQYNVDGKRYLTKEYSIWRNMFCRVNSPSRHLSDPNYKGCELGFESYNSFAEWCRDQTGFDKEGWVLDKDIVCDYLALTVKTYSSDTCVFIPIVINSFLTFSKRRTNTSGYTGVSKITSSEYKSNFMACCTNLNGVNTTLGRTDTAEESYKLYRKHKIKLAKVLADTYRGEVDPRVTYYLENFEKHIDDLAIFKTNN